jgi:hypothetical protein
MEKMMSNGPKESETLSRLNDFESELDAFNKSIGVVKVALDPETEKAMNLTGDELKLASLVDISSYVYKLQTYSYYLQKQYNRVKNLLKWGNHNLDIVCAKEGHNYGGQYTKYEERRNMVCVGNSYAVALNKIILDAGARMEEIEKLSDKIASVAHTLKDILQIRRYNNG